MTTRGALFIWIGALLACAFLLPNFPVHGTEDDIDETINIKENIKVSTGTDDQTLKREEESIKLDGLSNSEIKNILESAEKHEFQAEVSRLMTLIINSLYLNKEIFIRELVSNAADALNKYRSLSLTSNNNNDADAELAIKIKVDKENNVLHIMDNGIGMTKEDLINNLGTIAQSGTAKFLAKMKSEEKSEFIGQFGVGFYSSFLVAKRVVVTTKHNDDKQYIWESDSTSFSIAEDPRMDLPRGTIISLYMKDDASSFLNPDDIKKFVRTHSQFINFNIKLWQSKMETIEESVEEDETVEKDESSEEKPKTKSVEKTVWDWEIINIEKPIWIRKSEDITEEQYKEFYKSLTNNHDGIFGYIHFTAEGEVNFKALFYVPIKLPNDAFQNYVNTASKNVKLYVRRVLISDGSQSFLPNYLSFVHGVIDSDDFPLNVSRETIQQKDLLKLIKKKSVRKILDMIKKFTPEVFEKFWEEFSTNIKLGIMEDPSNRNRLAKLLCFKSSNNTEKQTKLHDYVERMKENQESIFYMAGTSLKEVQSSPFVERLLSKGYEILYLTEPIDEYTIQAIPEFEGKKFQNVAKDGLKLDSGDKEKKKHEELTTKFNALIVWLQDILKDDVEKVVISQLLIKSPATIVASSFGWSGNMERIVKSQAYAKAKDSTQEFYGNQKKILEINSRHPIIKEILVRIQENKEDPIAISNARLLFETATLRSGYSLKDTIGFSERIENIMRNSLNLSLDEQVEEEIEIEEDVPEEENADQSEQIIKEEDKNIEVEEHEEL